MAPQSTVISGRVCDVAGGAIAGACVFFLEGPVALPDIAALTNEKGEFSLSVPVPGAYRIGCAADGHPPAQVDTVIEAGSRPQVEINLT